MPVRTKVRSSSFDEGVDIAITHGRFQVEAEYPITVGQQFQATCIKFRERRALMYTEDSVWKYVTYAEYYMKCLHVAKSFSKLGLQKHNAVAIMGMNSPEWFYSNFGAIFAGGVSVALSTDATPEECKFILNDCKASILVVGEPCLLERIKVVRHELSNLKAIVLLQGSLSQEEDEDVYDWDAFLSLSQFESVRKIEELMVSLKPTQCCTLLYTLGTTGKPKGVMLSHDNVTWTAKALFRHTAPTVGWPEGAPTEVLSYMPLHCVAGQLIEVYFTLHAASTVYFAPVDISQGNLQEVLVDVQPFVFMAMPKTWGKLMDYIYFEGTNHINKRWEKWAISKALLAGKRIQQRKKLPLGMSFASKVLSRLKRQLGMKNALLLFGCTDKIPLNMVEFFMKYDMPLMETYGLAECSGVCQLNSMADWRLGSCGRSMNGTRVKINNPDNDGIGEIMVYGRHIFMGYLNDPQRTLETIDNRGWLHTGDFGKIDIDGFLTVVGRAEDLIVTSGGERVWPRPIEENIKSLIPYLGNVVVIGDKREFLTCLVTIKCVMDWDTEKPTDIVHPQVTGYLEELGCTLRSVSGIVKSFVQCVMENINYGIAAMNSQVDNKLQQVHKFVLLPSDFSVAEGELGPTMKLKRSVITERYESYIAEMYVGPHNI